nr:ribonuclease H-like domain-containing protein [Tanacetum cinerariifolium]
MRRIYNDEGGPVITKADERRTSVAGNANIAFDLRPAEDVLLWPGNANMAFNLRSTEDVLPWPGSANMAFDLRSTEDVLPWPGSANMAFDLRSTEDVLPWLGSENMAFDLVPNLKCLLRTWCESGIRLSNGLATPLHMFYIRRYLRGMHKDNYNVVAPGLIPISSTLGLCSNNITSSILVGNPWYNYKARFGGNAESKKIRKSMLKQEFSEFRIGEAEGLHKGYDRMQKTLSQLNQLKAKPEDEDINLKFLKALPSSWSQIALTLKTKGGLELLSFDDLYYKLKTLEVDVQGYTTFSSSQSAGPSHSAFLSRLCHRREPCQAEYQMWMHAANSPSRCS